jgi:dTMP kinase
MQQLKRGILIAIEGVDGCGKSTLARNTYTACTAKGLPTILTKEPGSSNLGTQLREILQKQDTPLEPKAEYLLFAADRAEHFTKLIIPALRNKQLIISDRMSDSSIVYQGYGRGLDIPMIEQINAWTMQGIKPDLVIFVAIDPHTAWQRIRARNEALTRFEQEGITFIQRLAQGFDTLFKHRNDVITLDGTDTPDILTQKATNAIQSWIHTHQLIQL